MKILLVGWNRLGRKKKGNWNHELFRREMARQHEVVFWGIDYDGYDKKLTVSDVLKRNSDIDIVLTHYEHRKHALARGLEDVKNVLKAHIMGGDYYEGTFKSYNEHLREVDYDIIFGRYSLQIRRLKEQGIGGKHCLLPFSVDINKYYKYNINRTIDVLASFQRHPRIHPNRHKIWGILAAMPDVISHVKKVWFEEYIKKINESKIFVTSNITDGELSGKYTEVLACGTLLLTTIPGDLDKLGYVDGKHLVIYKNDFSDLKDKIRYYLKHDEEREQIAKTGMELVRKNHSSEIRVREFIDIVKEEL